MPDKQSLIDSTDGFRGYDVAVAGGVVPLIDDRGSMRLWWDATGVMVVTPVGRHATCELLLLLTRPRRLRRRAAGVVRRRFALDTGAAATLAAGMRALMEARTHQRWGTERRLERLISRTRFDRRRVLPFELESARESAPREPAIGDVLHPTALAAQLPSAKITLLEVPGGAVSAVMVRYPEWVIELVQPRSALHLTGTLRDDPQTGTIEFSIAPGRALLLLAVQEAMACIPNVWPRLSPLERGRVEELNAQLLDMRREVLAGTLGLIEGYALLTALFGTGGATELTASMPPGQLHAIAIMALRTWTARHGSACDERRIDLARAAAIGGRAASSIDDELVIRGDSCELRVRSAGDVAVGHATVITAGDLEGRAVALCPQALELAAWAIAGCRRSARVSRALTYYLRRLLFDPFVDVDDASGRLCLELDDIANGRGTRRRPATRRAARTVLQRHPHTPVTATTRE